MIYAFQAVESLVKIMPISLGISMTASFAFILGSVQEHIFIGIAIGLVASGLFDVTKIPTKSKT